MRGSCATLRTIVGLHGSAVVLLQAARVQVSNTSAALCCLASAHLAMAVSKTSALPEDPHESKPVDPLPARADLCSGRAADPNLVRAPPSTAQIRQSKRKGLAGPHRLTPDICLPDLGWNQGPTDLTDGFRTQRDARMHVQTPRRQVTHARTRREYMEA